MDSIPSAVFAIFAPSQFSHPLVNLIPTISHRDLPPLSIYIGPNIIPYTSSTLIPTSSQHTPQITSHIFLNLTIHLIHSCDNTTEYLHHHPTRSLSKRTTSTHNTQLISYANAKYHRRYRPMLQYNFLD